MKKIGFIALFSSMALLANAQITHEQLAEKLRPEYRVDLSKQPIKTATPVAYSEPTKESLAQEIAELEAQIERVEQMMSDYQQKAPTATAANDAMLKKYQQAIAYNQEQIADKKLYAQKLNKSVKH